MKINLIFEQLIRHQNLTTKQMQDIIKECMSGSLTDVEIATFLALMRMKGETIEELTTAAEAIQTFSRPLDLGKGLIDIVGTGGDGKNTFNVSTVSSFVIAAAGLKVAKHGNRATSSRSGSADLLSKAGFILDLSDNAFRQCLDQCGIVFLFAPHFHKALKEVRAAREQLGIRTLFNLIGPLLNPAHATRQVVGVFSKQWLKPMANVLSNLGSEHALVVHSQDGLDEISIAASTDVVEYHNGKFKLWVIDPKDYQCFHPNLDGIIIETPEQSIALAESVFSGNKGPARDIVLLNAAAAIYCADPIHDFAHAIEKAASAIDSGEAGRRFSTLKELTQTLTGLEDEQYP
jgi:anthranilate phosphoribosyltransferase